MGRIPDRWEEYEPLGKLIVGTRFVSFKVPLKEDLCRWSRLDISSWFTPQKLIKLIENDGHQLGLIIDLTNTDRYYNRTEITDAGIGYVKIYTEGHIVPTAVVQKTFFDAVDNFLSENAGNDRLIGVHCTHGLNRTGYLVCRYMINRMKFEPQTAIDAFNVARGYSIERVNYLNDLLGFSDSSEQSTVEKLEQPSAGGSTAGSSCTQRLGTRQTSSSASQEEKTASSHRNSSRERPPRSIVSATTTLDHSLRSSTTSSDTHWNVVGGDLRHRLNQHRHDHAGVYHSGERHYDDSGYENYSYDYRRSMNDHPSHDNGNYRRMFHYDHGRFCDDDYDAGYSRRSNWLQHGNSGGYNQPQQRHRTPRLPSRQQGVGPGKRRGESYNIDDVPSKHQRHS
jgi:atypical dual specificity phosphatase